METLLRRFTKLVLPGRGLMDNRAKKIVQRFFVRVVRIFIMVARCSKCDFWNLGIIWHRNMWVEKILSDFFSSKKSEHFWSKIFWDQKFSRKKIVEKVNENSKF